MNEFFDKQSIDVPCPKCKRTVRKTVAQIKRSSHRCPNCGTTMDTSDFRRGVDKANREVERFKRDLGKLNNTIKI